VILYSFKTRIGTVAIQPTPSGRWEVLFRGESLGSYSSPQQAAEDASSGSTFSPSNGADLTQLGIPSDLTDWQQVIR
jgi:hypothetical protein